MLCQRKEPVKLGQVVPARPWTGKAWALALQAWHPLQGPASIDAIPIFLPSAPAFLFAIDPTVRYVVCSKGVSS